LAGHSLLGACHTTKSMTAWKQISARNAIRTARCRKAPAMTTKQIGINGAMYLAAGEKPAHQPIVKAAAGT